MNIILLDTETTSSDKDARLVQLAYMNPDSQEIFSAMYKPPVPISFGAMAITHITNEDVENHKPFEKSKDKKDLTKFLETNILVAHNAPFDIKILENEGVKVNEYIDTLRVAQHLIDSERHSLQYLRYSLGIYKDLEDENIVAHDATGDVIVLERLFYYLFETIETIYDNMEEEEILKEMIRLSKLPVLIKEFKFGKYKGKTFEEVYSEDKGYLEWLLKNESSKPKEEQNENLLHTLNYHLLSL